MPEDLSSAKQRFDALIEGTERAVARAMAGNYDLRRDPERWVTRLGAASGDLRAAAGRTRTTALEQGDTALAGRCVRLLADAAHQRKAVQQAVQQALSRDTAGDGEDDPDGDETAIEDGADDPGAEVSSAVLNDRVMASLRNARTFLSAGEAFEGRMTTQRLQFILSGVRDSCEEAVFAAERLRGRPDFTDEMMMTIGREMKALAAQRQTLIDVSMRELSGPFWKIKQHWAKHGSYYQVGALAVAVVLIYLCG